MPEHGSPISAVIKITGHIIGDFPKCTSKPLGYNSAYNINQFAKFIVRLIEVWQLIASLENTSHVALTNIDPWYLAG